MSTERLPPCSGIVPKGAPDIDETKRESIVPSDRLRQVLRQATDSLGGLLDKIDVTWFIY